MARSTISMAERLKSVREKRMLFKSAKVLASQTMVPDFSQESLLVMKSLLLFSIIFSSITLFQGCASIDASRDPSGFACHDVSSSSEDHHVNHCEDFQQKPDVHSDTY